MTAWIIHYSKFFTKIRISYYCLCSAVQLNFNRKIFLELKTSAALLCIYSTEWSKYVMTSYIYEDICLVCNKICCSVCVSWQNILRLHYISISFYIVDCFFLHFPSLRPLFPWLSGCRFYIGYFDEHFTLHNKCITSRSRSTNRFFAFKFCN